MRLSGAAVSTIVLVLFQGTLVAQPAPATRIANLKQRLSNVESALQAIQTAKQIDDLTIGDRVSSDLDGAAAEAKAAFEAALAQTRQLSNAGGNASQLTFLKDVEVQLRGERDRAEQIVEKMAAIDGSIRNGTIKLTTRAVQSLTPAQRIELRRTLTPAVQKEYKLQMPNLFPGNISSMTDEEWRALQHCSECETQAAAIRRADQPGLLSQVYDALTQGLVPPAEAALGIGCYGICAASLGVACLQCVAAAGGAAITAYNVYVSCRGSCCRCRWYKPWCCACKGICLVAFLAALA